MKSINPTHLLFLTKAMAVFLGALILVGNSLFWSLESSYLGAYGLWSELIDRELFESDFSVIWFSVNMLWPTLVFSSVVAVCMFMFFVLELISEFFNKKRISLINKGEKNLKGKEIESIRDSSKNLESEEVVLVVNDQVGVEKDGGECCSDEVGVNDRDSGRGGRFWGGAFLLSLSFILVFVVVILFVSRGMLYFSKEGRNIADRQIFNYIKNDICLDEVTDSSVGCYSSDLVGDDVLLVTNSDGAVSFLTKERRSDSGCGVYDVYLKVIYKSSGEVITRPYFPKSDDGGLSDLICVPEEVQLGIAALSSAKES